MPEVTISQAHIARMMRQVDRIQKQSEAINMISEETAAELLDVTVKTLQNNVSSGRMKGMFTVGAMGKRFYYRDKLIGIK